MPAARQPLLYAAFAFGVGIWLGTHLWRPPSWWLIAAAALASATAYFCRQRPRHAAALSLGTLVLLGAFSIQVRSPAADLNPEILAFADGNPVTIVAHVKKDGILGEGGYGGLRQVLDLGTEQISSADKSHILRGTIRLNIYSRAESASEHSTTTQRGMPRFTYGQRLRLVAKLRPPRNFGNPGAFDYRSYLAGQGIVALGSATAESVEMLPGFVGQRPILWRNQVRRSLLDKIHALWTPHQAVLMDAMVIGEDAFIDRDTVPTSSVPAPTTF